MEEVVFVQRNNQRSQPKILRVRDDGEFEVADTHFPSETAVLIGQYRDFLCFHDSQNSSFLVWNFRTRNLKNVGYTPGDYNAQVVSGFAKNGAGHIRIVMLARMGLSFATKIYRSELDQRNEAGEVGGDAPSGWGEWQTFDGNIPFQPHLDELSCFTLSEGFRCIYWVGSVTGRARIVCFNVETEAIRCDGGPANYQNFKLTIGHGVGGELAATAVHRADSIRVLRVWCLRGGEWQDLEHTILQNVPGQSVSNSYVPLCFYNRRGDQRLCFVFMKSHSSIVRMVPLQHLAEEEELFSGPSKIFTSALPQQSYTVSNKTYGKNRTREEEEELENQMRRKYPKLTCLDD